jgi:Transposase IS66 family/Transposase C of IS166 homeodomain
MQLDLDNLPSDPTLLHHLVRDMASVVERREGEIEHLQLIIKQLRTQFGRRSERIDADQLAFGLEDVETDKACAEAAQELAKPKDSKPRGGTAPPAAVYVFAPDRKGERPASDLEHFSGVLQVDGYAGFERLQARGNVVLAACWAHTRCYFYEFFEANGSLVAAEALRRIGELYAIEERIRVQSLCIEWPNGGRSPSRLSKI